MGDKSDEDDGFDLIQPTLIQQLKNILDQYPDNGQILKEIIQNAEDAGAKEVRFLYDENDESTFFGQGIDKLQGPSLYSYNDAYFCKEDWKGIRMFGKSLKEKDPLKVGKFGLGFKSIFHMSDDATIMSDRTLGIINPDENLFSFRGERRTGKVLDFNKQPSELKCSQEVHNDDSDMYKEILGTDIDNGICNGTLFRFSLRKVPSELSTTVYNRHKVMHLFNSFKSEGHLALIFMKNLEKIEFFIREKGERTAKLACSFSIDDANKQESSQKKKEFFDTLEQAETQHFSLEKSLLFETKILAQHWENGAVESQRIFNYTVIHHFAGKTLLEDDAMTKIAEEIGLLPLVGIAHPRNKDLPTGGHVFCTLPLPVLGNALTSLPVHINGFFALGPDRKDLKWPSASELKSSDKQVLWNQFLMEKALSAAYKEILCKMTSLNLPADVVYHLLPDLSIVDEKWRKLAEALFRRIFCLPCLWTGAFGGKWISPSNALFERVKENRDLGLDIAIKCLIYINALAVRIPTHVELAFSKLYDLEHIRTYIEPRLVRRTLRKSPDVINILEYEQRMKLLEYIISSVEDISELLEVAVIPLQSGSFAAVQTERAGKILIPSNEHPKDLLPGLEGSLLKTDIDAKLLDIFTDSGKQGKFQLSMLNENTIAESIKDVIFYNKPESVINLKCVSGKSTTAKWLRNLWKYARKYNLLPKLNGLPLIPVDIIGEEKQVLFCAEVTNQSRIIYLNDSVDYGQYDRDSWASFMTFLGCFVIRELPEYILEYNEIFKGKVFNFTAANIMLLLLNISQLQGVDNLVKGFRSYSNTKLKKAFMELMGDIRSFSQQEVSLLKKLPIFENSLTEEQVSVEEVSLVAPQNLPTAIPRRMLMRCNDATSRILASKLEAVLLTKEQLINDVIIPEILEKKHDDQSIDEFMEYILPDVATSKQASTNQIQNLKDIQFVTAANSRRFRPDKLFDPYNKDLKVLFSHDNGKFPAKMYEEEPYIQALRKLGLKSVSDLSVEDVHQIVESIPISENYSDSRKKAKLLVEQFENYPKVFSQEALEVLRNSQWIPVLQTRPNDYPKNLTWYAEENQNKKFERPLNMTCEANARILGAVMPLVSNEYSTKPIMKCILKSEVKLMNVLKQLKCVINRYEEEYKPEYVLVIRELYSQLSTFPVDDVKTTLSSLNLKHWVWNGTGFTSPEKIVVRFDADLDLSPYILQLAPEIQVYEEMLLPLGANKTCTVSMLIEVLKEMKEKYDRDSSETTENAVKNDLRLAAEIIFRLGKEGLPSDLCAKLFVPVKTETSVLKFEMAENTVYCPNRRQSSYGFEFPEDVNYLHEIVEENSATSLGIRSLTSKVLGAEDLGIFEEYGQTEPLTRRINRILQDYGDGSAIIKELIQNADDAGATEVKLLYDERQNRHQRSSLIDPGMQDFQGPALWAYNNATFSKQDFENITKLSGATKESQRDKIGKFGLGFNAVYNITDVPSFISEDHLVIFDPHTTNLGRAISNKSKPGVKINIGSNRNRLKHFKDQLAPYHGIFGMDMSLEENHQSFNGTLFRFPLRTKQQAIQSEIKNLCYDQSEMKQLLSKFASEATKVLIFTQNVNKIEVFYLKDTAANPVEMKELYTARKCNVREVVPLLVNERKLDASVLMSMSASVVDKAKQSKRNYQSIICSNIFNLTANISQMGKDYFQDQELNYSNHKWLIHSVNCSSDSTCLQMAFEHSKLNPVASVAISIREEDRQFNQFSFTPLDINSHEGQFFCFLPLPITNMLPVHVNSTFAVTHDRKSLQQVNNDNKCDSTTETRWNQALMAGPVSAAYLGALENLKKLASNFDESEWYEMWPVYSTEKPPYQEALLRSFYQQLVQERLKLFHDATIRQWIHWGEIIIIGNSLNEDMRKSMEAVIKLYVKDRFVIHLPDSVIKSMSDAGLTGELKLVTMNFEEFFVNVFQPNIKELSMPANVRDNVVLYSMKNLSNYPRIRSALTTTECIPTLPYGRLKSPNQLVRPKSKASTLYEESDEVFPAGERFNRWLNLEILEELGMVADEVLWEILERRAHTIVSLENQVTARNRSKCLIKLVDEKIQQNGCHEISDRWRGIKFLPVKPAPSRLCDIPWAGTSCKGKFHSMEGIYPSSLEHLVCCHSPIVDESEEGCGKLSKEVLEFFKIPTKAMLSEVCNQIDQILDVNLQVVTDSVKQMLISIYTYLDSCCKKNNSEGYQDVRSKFENKPLLVIGDELVQMKFVAFRHDYPSEPYLYKLPYNLTLNFRALMSAIGVKESFDLKDFIHALHCMENDYRNVQLQDAQIKMVRNILESIDSFKSEQSLPLFLPDNKRILYSNHDVHVKDARWIPDDPNLRYIHPDIPDGLALSLGAKTVRSYSINKNSIGMPFGQHEKLTVRLKKILDGYPGDIQIFHEILQNADDAGATNLQIVLDRRTHPNTSVFSDAWKSLQGPAILFCNNAPFTESDLQGIQNLGEGSKSNDPLKTGQFGVGFNVVYHVTDVPMLLTDVEGRGSVLCIFDPHATFLDECSLNEPGRMFSDARNFLKKQFPDVYETFIPTVLSDVKSTIFRLPIRDKSMALGSKIKQEAISVDNLREMLDKFKKEAAQSLVFLKHIESIELSEVTETGCFDQLFSICIEHTPEGKREKTCMNSEFKSVANAVKENKRDEIFGESSTYCYEMIIRDSKNSQKWQIIQKNACVSSSSLPPSVEEHYQKGLLRIFPSGGVACKQDKEATKHGKVFCLLPLQISSSLPLHINGNFILDYETRRKLWFSKDDCFQNDWNYYVLEKCVVPSYIALLENLTKQLRIDLGDSSAEEVIKRTFPKPKSGQNSLHHPSSYSDIIASNDVFSERHPDELQHFFDHFPVLTYSNKIFEYDCDFVKMFYKSLFTSQSCLIPVLHTSKDKHGKVEIDLCPSNADVKQVYIPDTDLSEGSKSFSAVEIENILLLLLKTGMHIYNIPQEIVRSFDESEVPLKRLSPLSVVQHLKSHADAILSSPRPLSQTIFKDVATVAAVLKYCLAFNGSTVYLEGLPLLVTEDDVLRKIDSSSEIYFKELSKLLPAKTSMCLHPHLRQHLAKYQHPTQGWLRRLTLPRLNQFLKEELPLELRNTDEIMLLTSADELFGKELATKNWLALLWNFLCQEHKRECQEHTRSEAKRLESYKRNYPRKRPYFSPMPERGLKEFLQEISDWCLIPTKRRQNENDQSMQKPYRESLMKIGLAGSVVCSNSPSVMLKTADELCLPFLHEAAIDLISNSSLGKENSRYIQRIFASDADPRSLLNALYSESKRESTAFHQMSRETANSVIQYFNDRCNLYSLDSSMLKSLPIFEDISGQMRALNKVRDVYCAPNEMPSAGISSFQSVIFLKEKKNSQNVFDNLLIEKQDLAFAYTKYIFPYFSFLSHEERLQHLEFLRIHESVTNEQLLPHLQSLPFIECKEGNLLRANHFYDPEVQVFKLMLSEEKFPPVPFFNKAWLPFLRKCGLKVTVSENMFLQFARDVSQATGSEKEEIRKRSKALVENLMHSEDLKNNLNFLDQLAGIEFLLEDQQPENLKQILSKDSEAMICFKDAIVHSHRNLTLAWAVENILPQYTSKLFTERSPFCTSLQENLQVKDRVSCLSVAKNFVNIVTKSRMLKNTVFRVHELTVKETFSDFEEIIEVAYEYLSKIDPSSNIEACSLLKENAVVLVSDRRFVVPKTTTLDQHNEIIPYLFTVPVKYGKYFEFFKALGTTEQATCEQFANVLYQIHESTNGKALSPNEASAVFSAASGLSKSIQSKDSPPLNVDLYLPGMISAHDATIKMYNARDIVYFDDKHFDERLCELKQPRMTFDDKEFTEDDVEKLISKLPQQSRPLYISEIIKEKLLEAEIVPNRDFAEKLQSKIQCEEFKGGMIRLLKHQLQKKSETDVQSAENLDMITMITNTRVATLREVKTALYYANEIVEASEEQRELFVIENDGILNFYVDQDQSGSFDGLNISTVARELSIFFRAFLTDPSLTPLISGLLSCFPEEMQLFLDKQNIRRSNETYVSSKAPYKIGEFVPVELHCLLVNDILEFENGEYVAYEAEDPIENDKNGDAVYIYARVIEKYDGNACGNCLNNYYKIEHFPGEDKVVHCSEIYRFERQDELAAAQSSDDFNDEQEEVDYEKHLAEKMKEITSLIERAFKESKNYFRKIIKRLYLRWHPDKNPGREEFCKRVFQHIQKEAERFEKMPEKFFVQFLYRGNNFESKRRSFRNNRSHYSWSHRGESQGFWNLHSGTKNPQPGEARRWFRQAKYDSEAAVFGLNEGYHEWVCFKCHQAAEKGLKAAVYTIDAKRLNTHDLRVIAQDTQNSYVEQLALRLECLIGSSTKLRYPNRWCYPAIPHTQYSRETALEALEITEKLMNEIRKIVE